MSDKNIDKDIEIVKEFIKKDYEPWSFYEKQGDELFELQEAIENVLSELEKKDKDNNDLRRLYRRTSEKLIENGKEELADYFLAQINEAPTFAVDDIDYYTEYYKQQKELKTYKKIAEKLALTILEIDVEEKDVYESICKSTNNNRCDEFEQGNCTECIIDWAKSEVLKNDK